MTHDDDAWRGLRDGLADRLGDWGFSPTARLRLLNISENAVFLAEEGARRAVLRVHRPGYHRPDEIASELAWIAALRAEGVVDTPAPIPGVDGRLSRGLMPGAAEPIVTAFDWVPGRSPEPQEDLSDWFLALGTVTARLHRHARHWARPPGFRRKCWTVETMLGRPGQSGGQSGGQWGGHWGDWRAAVGLAPMGEALLARAGAAIGTVLARYGMGPGRFGLIHGDLRLANLLVDGTRLSVIDFDDCGFGWFLYDFAAAVSFFEHAPVVPALMDAWCRGYRRLAPLSAEDLAVLPALVLLRRMLLLAWVASHPEAPTAQALGRAYTEGALPLAEEFLRSL
jgi:Ser/Thr protein kinase RdoA (MazF antagonist)